MKSINVFVIIFILLNLSCNTDTKVKYSFFVAGHTYGNHDAKNLGLYPPFKDKFELIKTNKDLKFGVLTGDVIRSGLLKQWDTVTKELKMLNLPIYFSRGNHDGPLDKFEQLHGKSYTFFKIKNDLHIVLDSTIDYCNISELQLEFIKTTLDNNQSVNNIFIYIHHKIWWNKEFYLPQNGSSLGNNLLFWETIFPLLKNTNKPVVLFAGDVGAFNYKNKPQFESFSYNTKSNITFITSGMGGGKNDNFIVCDVLNDNTIQYKLIHLNGNDINSLGKLKDYKKMKDDFRINKGYPWVTKGSINFSPNDSL